MQWCLVNFGLAKTDLLGGQEQLSMLSDKGVSTLSDKGVSSEHCASKEYCPYEMIAEVTKYFAGPRLVLSQ